MASNFKYLFNESIADTFNEISDESPSFEKYYFSDCKISEDTRFIIPLNTCNHENIPI